ncbi:MAG: MATE family efflux transporter [Nanoarchaeota archaeon]|nr:MATE family efflux transporter [Nanoarchaeota archaeon]
MKKKTGFLGTEKISKLLLNQAGPTVIGFLVMTLYHLVDMIFVGKGVGTLAIAGLGIVFPVQMIIMAVSQSIGVGIASIISRGLGANKQKLTEKALGNFFSMMLISGVVITVLGLLFIDPLLTLFGVTPEIYTYAHDYMNIVLFGSLFICIAAGGNNIIRAEGSAKAAMLTMVIGAIVNLILDPIFIFGMDMGVKGAALATVIAQFCSAAYALWFFLSNRSHVRLYFSNLRLNLTIVKESLAIGSSAAARQISVSVIAIVLNHSLVFYGGAVAIAALGIVSRMFMILWMPMFAISLGLMPIVGYNYGAKKLSRAKEAIILAIKWNTGLALFAFVIFIIFARQIFGVFSNDSALIDMGVRATRIIALLFPVIGYHIVAGSVYQSLGKAKPAFILSILRQVILLVPFVLLLPLFFGLDGIWIAYPVSDGLAFVITWLMLRRQMRTFEEKKNGRKIPVLQ